MGDKSAIEWTQATWNPVVGCSRVSSGCAKCYAIRDAHRMASNPNPKIGATYAGLTMRHGNGQLDWTGTIRCLPERLDQPLRWREPRRIFVNSMSDLFHKDIPDRFIRDVFAVMAAAHWHTFQVLTKRPERMAALLGRADFRDAVGHAAIVMATGTTAMKRYDADKAHAWPLSNVWAGTSVEDQRAADERIPHLLATPAAVRFLSCEPLLGPMFLLTPWLLDWVIAGAESGHGARPMDEEWVRALRDQCIAAGVAFFYKQNATPAGKKIPLPALDGRVWNEMPL